MPLCPNTYRRGSIYWWRRRFTDPATGRRRVLAFSLRVRDPRSARILGSGLNAEAGRLAREVESGMISFEVAEGVLESLAARQAALVGHGEVGTVQDDAVANRATYSAAQERSMLLAMGRDIEARLAVEAVYNRTHGGLEVPAAIDAQAVTGERALGFIYKLVATRGFRARVCDADRTDMAARGLSPELIGYVKRETAYRARREWPDTWQLGPDRDYFARFLNEAGAAVTDGNVVALRSAYLALFAEFLFDAERRYATTKSDIDEVMSELRGVMLAADAPGSAPAVKQDLQARSAADTQASEVVARPPSETPAAKPTVVEPSSAGSFTGRVATLAKRKVRLKQDNQPDGWDGKTAKQHLSIARLFVKLAGSDDPAVMGQAHIGRYRDLLDLLPKSWGKSTKDEHRSLEEILARCEDLDDDEIGLAPATINRHMTQLGTCLTNLAGHGATIGEITRDMRTKGVSRERAIFSTEDEAALFASPVWTGPDVVHDSNYFVPLFAKYEVLRLNEIIGLVPEDFDLDKGLFHVRPNRIRGLKNSASIRCLPIMSEIQRLGFCDYLERILSLGLPIVWPDIPLRGTATPMQNLYYKAWSLLLATALPNASVERKYMHSWRKAGNSAMAGANINDPLRYQILGHAYRDVNGRHYTGTLSIEEKRAALSVIAVTTGHIEQRPLRIHPDLTIK